MIAEQEAHLARVKAQFAAAVDAKYRAGAAQHGDDLLAMAALRLIDEAMQETVDQYVFLQRTREVIQEFVKGVTK